MNRRLTALYEGLQYWRTQTFEWPGPNCCHYVKDMLDRQGFAVDFEVPEVSGPEEAEAWLQERGHRSLYHFALTVLGASKGPLQARRGDVMYNSTLDAGALGIADREGWFLSEGGLIAVPLAKCQRVFKVAFDG